MDTTPNIIPMFRRTIAYAVTFVSFYILGAMDSMRLWAQFGLFFSGLIAATVLSFFFFLFIGAFIPPKAGKGVQAVIFATEVIASIIVLKLVIPIIPTN
ncbi:hypothetical protein [Fundidesulfovibrio soli]|uniref:hypothetical protein n=1 Tax=Fundidesulfovibrio soli TaxID=2922716 RepID=UPI001FAFD6B3|nr:hypothetical protein [Fundidesulfovibrio soli]